MNELVLTYIFEMHILLNEHLVLNAFFGSVVRFAFRMESRSHRNRYPYAALVFREKMEKSYATCTSHHSNKSGPSRPTQLVCIPRRLLGLGAGKAPYGFRLPSRATLPCSRSSAQLCSCGSRASCASHVAFCEPRVQPSLQPPTAV